MICQFKYPVDHRFDATALQVRVDAFAQLLAHHRFLFEALGAKGGSGQCDALHQQRCKVHLGLETANEGNVNDTSLGRRDINILLYEIAASHVQDHVYPVLQARLGEHLHKVRGFVIDGQYGAEVLKCRALLVRAGGGIHLATHRVGHLDTQGADAAGAAVYKHPLSGLHGSALEHIVPHGEQCLRQGGSFFHSEWTWHRQALAGRRHRVVGIAATVGEGAHGVAHGPVLDTLTECNDLARDFQADDG